MTLPTFVGIGVPRAGTTWLHTLLDGHPQVYLPTRRKEVRFFDRHFEHGLDWYEGFFCTPGEAARYQAIGEISPQYLYERGCADRIFEVLPSAKLLVMLRHPVDRAYSQYGFILQRRNFRGSFEEFIRTRPRAGASDQKRSAGARWTSSTTSATPSTTKRRLARGRSRCTPRNTLRSRTAVSGCIAGSTSSSAKLSRRAAIPSGSRSRKKIDSCGSTHDPGWSRLPDPLRTWRAR